MKGNFAVLGALAWCWLSTLSGFAATPSLSIQTLAGQLQITWPSDAAGFNLEQADSLSSPVQWRAVTESVANAGGRFSVTIPAATQTRFYRLRGASLTTILETSPAPGETGVAVTRETVFRLSAPLAANATVTTGQIFAEFGGRRWLTRAELSSDRQTVTLFYLENLPASARVRVSLVGDGLKDASGTDLDADGDGQAGGTKALQFDTASISALPSTGITGRVFASELGATGTNRPLAGVIVTVDGAEETLRATTDVTGSFKLQPAPAGRFFVHVDGRTAIGSQWPGGAYYPFVGKAWETVPGRTNNLAGGSGEIFLPLIQADALKTVSATEETRITFVPSVLTANPSLAGVEIMVPANALFSDNGTRGGKVGIAPVPPDRLPEPLPRGLNLPLVITIQTDGSSNFDRPVPAKFPNLPDPVTGIRLPPGAKTTLWGFNHDTGRWEIQGTMTISADGQFAVTDPGVGARQPGWYGVAPGTPVGGPEGCLGAECDGPNCGGHPPACCGSWEELKKPCKVKQDLALNAIQDLAVDDGIFALGGPGGCQLGSLLSTMRVERDCTKVGQFSDDCGTIVRDGAIGNALGCVPGIGGYLGLAWGAKSVVEGALAYKDCIDKVVAACSAPVGLASSLKAAAGSDDPRLERAIAALELQTRVAESASNALTRIMGNAVWAHAPSPEVYATYHTFMTALADGLSAAGPGGSTVTSTERAAILALPFPNGATAADANVLIDRIEGFGLGLLKTNLAVRAEVGSGFDILISALEEAQSKGWGDLLDGLRQALAEFTSMFRPRADSFPARSLYYRLGDLQTGFVQRGRLSAVGRFEGVILRPESYYSISYFDPVTFNLGASFFRSNKAGAIIGIPTAQLGMFPTGTLDGDGDGLLDVVEAIVGTDPGKPDTDGDGVRDGDELKTDGNPLDGQPAALGVTAQIDLNGTALGIGVQNNIAVVGLSDAGVAFIDVSKPTSPLLLGTLDTPGNATAVAFTRNLVAVADGTGVSVFDLSDRTRPQFIREISGQAASAIAASDNRLYYGSARVLNVVNAADGALQTRLDLTENLDDLQAFDGFLYVLTRTNLQVYAINGPALTARGSVAVAGLPAPLEVGRKLFVGGGYAYIGTVQGWRVVDVRNPDALLVVGTSSSTQNAVHDLAFDGGQLFAVTSFAGSQPRASVYNAKNPNVVTNFLTSFGTPGEPRAVALHRGYGLVADSGGGLSVVNYLARDASTNPPAVTVRGRFGIAAPPTHPSGQPFSAVADATDDVLVRNIEFYIDDLLVADATSYPFEVELRAPVLTATRTNFILRARAFDTGGNAAWSQSLTVLLAPYVAPPELLAFTPAVDPIFLVGTPVSVSARFSEPLAAATLNSGFTLISLGADAKLGTADDALVPSTVTSAGTNEYELNFSQPLAMGTYAAKLGTNLSGVLGNHLPSEITWLFRIQPLLQFIGVSNLAWNATSRTSNNWSPATIPTTNDFVRIAASGGATVNVSQVVNAFDLTTITPLSFASGTTLRIGRQAVFEGPVTLRSGTWQGGNVILRAATQISSIPNLVDQDWNNEGHVTFGPDASFAFRNSPGTRTTLRNLPGATWETVNSQMIIASISSGPADFENQGLLIARGTNRNSIGTSRFINLGWVEVREGILDLNAGSINNGASQHLGSYRVDAGAALRFTGLSQFGRASRIFGGGIVQFTSSASVITVFPGSYEIDGETTMTGNVNFSGPVRSGGTWRTSGGHAIFTGLNPEISGPVVSEGALTVSVLPLMRLSDLRVYRDCTITTALEVNGPLLLDSTVTPGGSSAAARLLGNGRLRANGPLSFAGIVNSAGEGILEIGGTATCKLSAILQLNGSEIKVLPGGTFDVSGAQRVSPRAFPIRTSIINEGTILKTDTNSVLLTSAIQNSGTVRVSAGTLIIENGNFLQIAGVLSLSGGNLTVRGAGSFVGDFTLRLQGGKLEGAGRITCASATNSTQIMPGSPSGILDFQVGTHPTLSVYQQTLTGKLTLDIAGATPGTEHDQVTITGRALLNGALEIKSAPNFNPALGQEFTILTSAKVEGTFAAVTGTALPGGKRFDVIYETAAVKLRVVAAP